MNKYKSFKKDGWISLYSVIIAFLMFTFSLALLNIYASNLRMNMSLSGKNYLDIQKSNIKNIVKASMSKYLYTIKQDVISKYPAYDQSKLFNQFQGELVKNLNSNLDNIMIYRPLLDNELRNSNMEMSYKLRYNEHGGLSFQPFIGSLKFDIDIILNVKGEDVIEECIYRVTPNFEDKNAEVKVEIQKVWSN